MEYKILPGFILNPNQKIVEGISKALLRCNGRCPCYHGDEIPDEDLICPCKEYRVNNHCRCNLYLKDGESSKES